MATCRGGSSTKTKLGFLIYGKQGTRKSSFCLEMLKLKNEKDENFKVLYIDAENGSIDSYLELYEEQGYNLKDIYIVYTQSMSEVQDFIRKARGNEDFYEYDEDGNETEDIYLDSNGNPFRPDAIVVDGVTLLYIAKQQSYVEFSKKRAMVRVKKNEITGMEKDVAIEGASIEIKDYNSLKFNGQNLILDLLSCGKHFAVTMREADEKEQYRDAKTGEIKSMATGNKIPEGFKDVAYNVKTVMRLFQDEDGIIKGLIADKDRTLVHSQYDILVEPSILDWQIAIDKNKNKKEFCLSNSLNKSVDIEREIIEKQNSKFDEEYEKLDKPKNSENLNTIEDYHNAINEVMKKLTTVEKSKKKTELVNAKLPGAYQKINDIEELKKFYDIISK